MYEHIVDKDFIYLMRTYWNRGNLIEAMIATQSNVLTEEEIRKPVRNIFQALSAIHKVGYLHGDVRPQNIFIHQSTQTGEIRCAFGDFDRCCPINVQAL